MAVHGRSATYSNGCRCADCREAWRVYCAERRRARGVQTLAEYNDARAERRTHTIATYNHGCRCDRCRNAAREARAYYRARAR